MQAKFLITITLICMMAFSLLGSVYVSAAAPVLPVFKLSIEPLAPKLPADGGKYYAMIQLQTEDGKPAPAPHDIDVDLLSSDPSVFSLPSKVTIKEEQSSVRVDLLATQKVGKVTLNALASGVMAGKASLETVTPLRLQPTKLAVYLAPSNIPPDAGLVGKVYVQLLNSQNLPATATTAIEVTLSSHNVDIVKVPPKTTIDTNSSGKFVDYTPGIVVGSTEITASASGLDTGTANISTSGLLSEKIIVEVAPIKLPATKGAEALATIQLVDQGGFLAKTSKSVTVFLKSSDDTIVSILEPETDRGFSSGQQSESVVIEAGHSYATTKIRTEGRNGTAIITATASGYESGFANVEAAEPASKGTKLVLFLNPSVLPPDNTKHNNIIVQVQDDSGKPYSPRLSELQLVVTSSNANVGNADDTISFVDNPTYAVGSFRTKFVPGDTTITVSQTGYVSAQALLLVKGPKTNSIKISEVPSVIQADMQSYSAIVVELFDDRGSSVQAPRDIRVDLSSSEPRVVTVDPVITIPEGKSYAIAQVTTTDQPGVSMITASSQDLSSDALTFKTVAINLQYKLALYFMPRIVPADGETHQSVVVQLQDASGSPVPAPSDLNVSLSSSSVIAGAVDRSLNIHEGSSYAVANFNTSMASDRSTITASAQGYESVSSILDTSSQPLTLTTSRIPPNFGLTNVPFEVDVTFKNIPIKGALVQVTGTHADVTTAVTDEKGHAKVTYAPTAPGQNTISITVSKKGYSTLTSDTGVMITQSVTVTVKAITDAGREVSGTHIEITPPVGSKIAQDTAAGVPVTLNNVNYGLYRILVPKEVRTGNAVYKFEKWSDGVTDDPRDTNVAYDSNLAAVYSAQYLLQVSSPYGTVTGTGWYKEGSTTNLSVQPTSQSEVFIDRSFAGWSGDINSDTPTITVIMDSPKSVIAKWNDGYAKLIGIIGGVGGVAGFVLYKKVGKNGLQRDKPKPPPDLEWFKS